MDPAECNALQGGPAGLLVPEVQLQADPGVSVTAPAAADCPQVWRVGVDGAWVQTEPTVFLHTLAGPSWQFEPVAALPAVTIPRAGWWEVNYQVRGASAIYEANTGTVNRNNGVGAGLLHNGVILPGSELTVILQMQQPGDQGRHLQATGSIRRIWQFNAGDTLQLAGRPFLDPPGSPDVIGGGIAQVLGDSNGWTHVTAHWIGPVGDTGS
ncbi:putative secreted protein [Streptomyces gancidicus BKS 13-15]|uniref:Putative secreted protein n=1 Tax=Streptomyces gancidicus BKS 13-15 TaxID=1284664 RepID=M3DFJ7_STREZ|nr:hypothetical protein [Streptomyces gancidicus]EMF20417.1 putative secreted protein [Streptomyces gancidicus BKS 13-15]